MPKMEELNELIRQKAMKKLRAEVEDIFEPLRNLPEANLEVDKINSKIRFAEGDQYITYTMMLYEFMEFVIRHRSSRVYSQAVGDFLKRVEEFQVLTEELQGRLDDHG